MTQTQHISLLNFFHRQNSVNAEPESTSEPISNEAESQTRPPVPTRLRMSLPEDENTFLVGASSLGDLPRDRHGFDRQQVMADCLDAWRFNPLARRIVELTSQYITGGGMAPRCEHAATQAFLREVWNHPLNHMDARLGELSDELARSGNLFLLLSTDASGMSYLRVVPSADIERIESRANDVEQEVAYYTRPDAEGEVTRYPAFTPWQGTPDLQSMMLHYAINRPAGAQWGEPDLAPVLRWLSRYAAWLEDRVRLNRFRNAFMYVVKARFANESARSTRQLQLAANPPGPGSVLVTDENEEWSVLSPHLEALDASSDGLAIKKMIAAGVGLPLHFLAEPESSTRTTAEAADGATLQRFAQRQRFLQWILADMLRAAVSRSALVDTRVDPQAEVRILAGDISARDNQSLAEAGSKVAEVAQALYAQGLIDKDEMLRLIYRFLGEGGSHVEV